MGNNPDGLGAAVAFGELGDAPISDFLQTVFQGQTMGYIVGDIEISDEDEIIVTDGKTLFDGVVNPECEGETPCDRGELTINGPGVDDDGIDRAGGTLVLLQNEDESRPTSMSASSTSMRAAPSWSSSRRRTILCRVWRLRQPT